jgi:hypothetical protein
MCLWPLLDRRRHGLPSLSPWPRLSIQRFLSSHNLSLGTRKSNLLYSLFPRATIVRPQPPQRDTFVLLVHIAWVLKTRVQFVRRGMLALTIAALVVTCSSGSYSVSGSSECTICRAGYFCPQSDASLEIPCADGTYSLAGSTSCTPCPAGYMCANSNGTSIVSCDSGYYSVEGDMDCHACPAGYASVLLKLWMWKRSVSWELGNQTSCTSCPAGYHCPSPSTESVIACSPGSFSTGNKLHALFAQLAMHVPRRSQTQSLLVPSARIPCWATIMFFLSFWIVL